MDEARLLAWIAITWLAMRALSSCTFAVFECNFVAFRAVAVQVQTRSEATTPRRCWDAGSGREQSAKAAASSRPRQKGMFASSIHDICNLRLTIDVAPPSSTSQPSRTTQNSSKPQPYRSTIHTPAPPPPYSPRRTSEPANSPDLIPLYEDIIASDAQTIQTQQATLAAQQEIIRAQAQMIQKLRHVLEEQDRTMEEVDESMRAGRCRRGMGDMRSRSA